MASALTPLGGTLSGEVAEIYRHNDSDKNAESHGKQREVYRKALNRVMWKYGVTTPTRMAHFLGQGGHECGTLLTVEEGVIGTQYENRQDLGNVRSGDGPRFKGRGMKQLTGCCNYVAYWVYRGWLDASWLDKIWYKRQIRKKDGSKVWVDPKDDPPVLSKPEPESLSKNAFTAIDSGGWFWEARGGRPDNPQQKDSTGVWFYDSHAHQKSINSLFVEGQVDDKTIDKISDAINPGEEGDLKKESGDHVLSDRRLKRRPMTWHAWNAIHDFPEPFPVKEYKSEKQGKGATKKSGGSGKSSSKSSGASSKGAGAQGNQAAAPPASAVAKPAAKKSLLGKLFGW